MVCVSSDTIKFTTIMYTVHITSKLHGTNNIAHEVKLKNVTHITTSKCTHYTPVIVINACASFKWLIMLTRLSNVEIQSK